MCVDVSISTGPEVSAMHNWQLLIADHYQAASVIHSFIDFKVVGPTMTI